MSADAVHGSEREGVRWEAVYRDRSRLDPLRAVLDPGDPDNIKNAYVDRLERIHLGRAMGRGPFGRVLDLGCGVGRFADLLVGRSATVAALDRSHDLLRAAAGRSLPSPYRFARADGRALPLPDGSVDRVLTCEVLIHMVRDSDLREVASEVRRVLRSGGRAVLLEHIAPGPVSERREGIVYRSEAEFRLPFEQAGLRVLSARAVRKVPSRLVHWARRGFLPRILWGLAARLEPWLAMRGREPPAYRDHLFVFEKPGP